MARLALRPDDLIAPAADALLEADVRLEAGVPLEGAEARRSAAQALGFRLLYPLLHTARVMGYAPLLLGLTPSPSPSPSPNPNQVRAAAARLARPLAEAHALRGRLLLHPPLPLRHLAQGCRRHGAPGQD